MTNKDHTLKQLLFEMSLMALALLFTITVGSSVTNDAEKGLNRWRSDLVNDEPQITFPASDQLMAKWCFRDFEYIQIWFSDQAGSLCPREIGNFWIAKVFSESFTQPSPESTVKRWQSEVDELTKKWRKLISINDATDMSFTVLTELSITDNKDSEISERLSLERQAAEAWLHKLEARRENIQQWDSWQERVVQPALRAPANEITAQTLITAARSLEGIGNDPAAQLVRRHLSANQNALRASKLINITKNLPVVLISHWLMTITLLLILRWRLSLSQRLTAGLILAFAAWWGFYFVGIASNPLHSSYWLMAGCLILTVNWLWNTFFQVGESSLQSIHPFSKWVMPAWWLFTALGWLLMLDQSLNFHARNRFLALEQFQAWFLASWIVPISAQSSFMVANGLLWVGAHWFKPCRWQQHFWHLLAGFLVVVMMYTAHRFRVQQHITGEALKLIFVLSISAWCVWRMPTTSNLWHAGLRTRALIHAWPSLWILVLATAISLVTRDKGPLLVICMTMVVLFSSLVGWLTGLVMIAFGFLLIFLIGVDLDIIGSRLKAWHDPFTADHDDMARLMWFQSAAAEQPWGFGPGQVPWCGMSSFDLCRGLPLQLQSDYTFTSIVGWWGLTGSILLLLIFTVFCFHLLAHGARSNQLCMRPLAMFNQSQRLMAVKSHMLFFTGTLILLQVWITVAGNTGWLPLTGLTWPLLSFGKTSLWFTTWLISSWGFETKYA